MAWWMDDPEKFWSLVDRTSGCLNGCWLWLGNLNKGYGQVCVGNRTFRAHRCAWEIAHGPIPEGMLVRHRCDVRACVCPDHLVLGSHQDNMDDMTSRGRSLQGERHPHVRLTDDQVEEIRTRYIPGQVRQADLAAEFGVRQCHISRLVRREETKR